jgi:hypothetical protein
LFSLKTKVDRFPDLDLKTGICSLVIWPIKSLRRFFWFGPTKWATIYRLCHKTDGRMKMARDTH